MDLSSYIMSKRYTDDNIIKTKQFVEDTVVGGGAIKGAPCQVQLVEEVEGGSKITLAWQLNDGTTRTSTVFLKNGTDGVDGKDGAMGPTGKPGKDGKDGANGLDGIDGVDGVGIVKLEQTRVDEDTTLLTVYLSDGSNYSFEVNDGKNGINGTNGKDGANGIDGIDGKDGKDGKDGVSIIASEINEANELVFTFSDGNTINVGNVVGLNGKDGVDGADGKDGANGKDGVDGKDGLTPEIGENGNWIVGDVDTGVAAAPDLSGYYNEDNFSPLTDAEIDQLCAEEEV